MKGAIIKVKNENLVSFLEENYNLSKFKIVEVPVRYRRRRYGKTQISRFRHGVLLIQMVIFAYKKLKIFAIIFRNLAQKLEKNYL